MKYSSKLHGGKSQSEEEQCRIEVEENRTREEMYSNQQIEKQTDCQAEGQQNRRTKQQMLAPCSSRPICLCALQPHSSKPQQEVSSSALLPGLTIKPPQSIYLLLGLHSALIFQMQLIWANPSCVSLAQSPCTWMCVCVRPCVVEQDTQKEREVGMKKTIVCLWGSSVSTSEATFIQDAVIFGTGKPFSDCRWQQPHWLSPQLQHARQPQLFMEIGIAGASQDDFSIQSSLFIQLMISMCFRSKSRADSSLVWNVN